VGVFVGQGAEEILAIMAEARLDLAQLHGEQSLLVARAIGAQRAIRVFWPERYGGRSDDWARDLELWSKEVAYFLFDAGLSGGGHGRQLDLQRSSPAGETWFSPRPYFLAGGLKPGDWPKLWPNDDPRLVGLDFNSGVEISPGVKDLLAIKALVAAREIGV
jgi:phosphoribosylanthranilate isomerase